MKPFWAKHGPNFDTVNKSTSINNEQIYILDTDNERSSKHPIVKRLNVEKHQYYISVGG